MSNFTDKFEKIKLDKFGLVRLPKIVIGDEQKIKVGIDINSSNFDYLRAVSRVGFNEKMKRIDKSKHKLYIDQAKYELQIFEELGFVDYILLVDMVVQKAKSFGTFMDFGRGSVSGSTICWFLGISGVDPIEKKLIFERFVSRVRSKKQIIDGEIYLQGDLIADVDINLGDSREKIVEWLKEIYPNRISKIATQSSFSGKILIKDVYKTFEEVDEQECKKIASLVEAHSGVTEDLTETYEKSAEFREWAKEHRQTYDICLSLRDLIRQKSCHASGYLVSFYDFDGFLPMELNKEKELTCSYSMKYVSNFSLKLDLLGLTTNQHIKRIVDRIGEKVGDINLDDNPLIYDQLQTDNLLPYGLYQISADCAYRVTQKIHPRNVLELSDVSAIARPGALDYLKLYAENTAKSPHPLFDKIIKETRNLFLYQEQLMQALVAVGFDLDSAETCRKIVGKKLIKEVKEWQEKIKNKVKENNLPEELSTILWKVLEDSAKYSFNKSHSLSVAYLSSLTVYLKYKYPVLFYWSALESTRDLASPMEEIALIVKELPFFKIRLLPPNLATAETGFTIIGQNIQFGLNSIRGVSNENMKKLTNFKRDFNNLFEVFDSAKSAHVPINVLTGLINAGCLDRPDITRAKICLYSQTYNILTDKEKRLVHSLSSEFKDNLLEILVALTKRTDERGKFYVKESRMQTIKKSYEPFKKMFIENSKNPLLTSYIMERNYLGYSFSTSLFSIFTEKVEGLQTIDKVIVEAKGIFVKFVGFINEIKTHVSLSKKLPYLKLEVSDDSATLKCMLFNSKDNDRIEALRQFHGKLPEPGDIVIIHGKKADGDAVFVDKLFIQNNPVKIKKSELSKDDGNNI